MAFGGIFHYKLKCQMFGKSICVSYGTIFKHCFNFL
jgi:hypothetical protein